MQIKKYIVTCTILLNVTIYIYIYIYYLLFVIIIIDIMMWWVSVCVNGPLQPPSVPHPLFPQQQGKDGSPRDPHSGNTR